MNSYSIARKEISELSSIFEFKYLWKDANKKIDVSEKLIIQKFNFLSFLKFPCIFHLGIERIWKVKQICNSTIDDQCDKKFDQYKEVVDNFSPFFNAEDLAIKLDEKANMA